MPKRIEGQMGDWHVHTRLNWGEYEAWGNLVRKLGTTRSRLMRQLIREAIGQGPEALAGDFEEVREAARQVAAVGRNLNQTARHLNSGRGLDGAEVCASYKAVQEAVERVETKLDEVIYRSRDRWVHRGKR